ncbi:BTAD domain-containing putative transcriptional regulator [Microbispora corallina]|uniref:BTAD domain-containing putative transcriptional regulator n=1 Tax=Microbispora corallina TaxID=83302 RepID=UPI0031E4623B
MRIGILGTLSVSGAEIGGARVRALLVRLALDPGRVVTYERLAEDLWPDDTPEHPPAALQSLVSRLRRQAPGLVRSHPSGYLLDVPREAVDAWEFERLTRAGRATSADPVEAGSLLRRALSLWRGPALADVAGLPFATAPAARLDELRAVALEGRIAADLAVRPGRRAGVPAPEELIAEIEEAVAAHPLREPLHALRVRALLAGGRRADALAAFERIRRRLADELGVDPGPELREAHLAALREDGAGPPVREGNLPAAVTSFVGRRADVLRVRELLGRARLVTLTGPGGAGKTRLAVEAARGLAGEVWLVELAPVTDPAGVAAAVRAMLPLPAPGVGDGRRDALEALVADLRGFGGVVVLDNCEHVVAEAARVAGRLLAGVPGLRILATGREALDIPGEHLHPVLPLELPAVGATVEEARACGAVALFADRAAAVRPGFAVDDAGVADVVRVCRELDGMPLAIELAAARLRSMPLPRLVEGLGGRLAFRGGRTAEPRHRTLRAVIGWSWDLLDPEEQALLRRLSVFAGGVTAESVGRVCGGGARVPALLASLADKSLVVVVERAAEIRYRLLETVRSYAAERLVESGEADETRARHARHFLEVAEAVEPLLRGREQSRVLAVLDAERGDLDAALELALASGDGRAALRMMMARFWSWMMRGRRREAAERARAVLGVVGGVAPEGLEVAHALCALVAPGDPYLVNGTPGAERALRVVEESGHPAALWSWMGATAYAGGAGEIRRRAAAAVERFEGHPDAWKRATALLVGGIVEFEYGRPGEGAAEARLREALGVFGGLGDRWGLALAHYWLSFVVENRGDAAGAREWKEEAAALAEVIGGGEGLPGPVMLRVRLGRLRACAGDVEGAAAELRRVGEVAERLADPVAVGRVRHALGEVARRRGRPEEAEPLLAEALGLLEGRAGAPPQLAALVRMEMGRVRAARGDAAGAREWMRRAVELSGPSGDATVRAAVLEAAAVVFAEDPARAAALAGAAQALRGLADTAGTADPEVLAVVAKAAAGLGEAGCREALARGAGLAHPEDLLAGQA